MGGDGKLFRAAAREIKALLDAEGVGDMPLGVDVVEVPMMLELQKLGIDVRDAQQTMLQAREIKNIDELMLLNMAAAMVDGVYQEIAEKLKPGVKESEIVALATMRLYLMGSDCVEAINAISGERCNPHPHNFTDRIIRPGDQAFFDIIHSYMGYKTCYYRTFSVGMATQPQRDAYQRAREWMDRAIDLLKPGVSSHVVAASFPTSQEIGFATEMDAFGLNFCHGLGLGLHERPLISRLSSLEEPIELKTGMVFAVETYCPASDGVSAARIEEEVILTPTGPEGDLALSGAGTADRQPLLGLRDHHGRPLPLKLGWIGIGRMGYAMAARLAKGGADLTVWNRTRAKAEPLAALGAKIADRAHRTGGLRHRVRDGRRPGTT